jgi:hypothetical protein
MIAATDKLAALLESLRGVDFDTIPPAKRRQIADVCRWLADKAEPQKPDGPSAGVLADLRDGGRAD